MSHMETSISTITTAIATSPWNVVIQVSPIYVAGIGGFEVILLFPVYNLCSS